MIDRIEGLFKINKQHAIQETVVNINEGGWIEVCKSADPLKLMAESVDPLKKST